MQEEQQKRSKLFSVIYGLTSIKEQLQQLMPPKSEERTNDTNQKYQNTLCLDTHKAKASPEKQERCLFKSPAHKFQDRTSSRSLQNRVLAFHPKNKLTKQSPPKIDRERIQSSQRQLISQNKNPISFVRLEGGVKSGEKSQFLAKKHRDQNNKVFVDMVERAANEEEWMSGNQKTFSHCRHSSQKDLSKGKSFNSLLGHTLDPQRQFKKQQKNHKKPFFQFKHPYKHKKMHLMPDRKILTRMKSDIVDSSQPFRFSIAQNVELEGQSTSRQDLAQKIKELQQQNYQKQGIIHILEAQLAEIQNNFTEIRHSIAKILRIGGSASNLEQLDLNQELHQFTRIFQSQRDQMKKISVDCELWKQKSIQLSMQIKQFQAQLEQHGRIGLAFDEVKEQNCRLKDHLVNISSKLEVSVNQNRIKDEFIVKFLVGKGAAQRQDDKIGQILSTFQEYFKTFSYPSNRLLQKLNEQQQQIKRLKQLLQKRGICQV